MSLNMLPATFGVLGLIVAYLIYLYIKKHPPGTGKVVEIGEEIHKGAMAFMRREYQILVSILSKTLWTSDSEKRLWPSSQ